jgi:hypothetical protein
MPCRLSLWHRGRESDNGWYVIHGTREISIGIWTCTPCVGHQQTCLDLTTPWTATHFRRMAISVHYIDMIEGPFIYRQCIGLCELFTILCRPFISSLRVFYTFLFVALTGSEFSLRIAMLSGLIIENLCQNIIVCILLVLVDQASPTRNNILMQCLKKHCV